MHDIELKPKEFALFRTYIYEKVGISLSEQKTTLIKGRLNGRLNRMGFTSYTDYYNFLVNDKSGEELTHFVSAISTNLTSFFRESAQWKWLETYIPTLVDAKKEKKIRIWSAGCSSGEEPYTILMFLQEQLSDFNSWDIKILATDISSKVLKHAMDGIYDAKSVDALPGHIISKAFDPISTDKGPQYQIKQYLRNKITFRLYNLVTDPFFIKNEFDMIFCRNVMIYFDDVTRQEVIGKFATLLPKGAPMFLGSSESLMTHRDIFKLLGASIYQRL